MSLQPMQPAASANDLDMMTVVAELQGRLDTMQRFMSRRFDEISMEINATAQQMDMAGEDISKRFGEILSLLGAISFHGDGMTPHNMGVELDAVVKTTEDAANRILDAAMQIEDLTAAPIDWADESVRGPHLAKFSEQAQNILVACAFQDLTGQRIGKTLDRIRAAEKELSDTLKAIGLRIDISQEQALATAMPNSIVSNQDDIDALFK